MTTLHSPMLQALHAAQPAEDRASQLMLYGQFIGSWEGKAFSQPLTVDAAGEVNFEEGEPQEASLEVHFDWVLQGRVIQDVWILPARKDAASMQYSMYGTTLRVYDPQQDCWFITFIDPFTQQSYHRMVGRKVGNDIVQEYRNPKGKIVHWMFTEITENSFHWMWKESVDNGKTWKTPAEFFLQRKS